MPREHLTTRLNTTCASSVDDTRHDASGLTLHRHPQPLHPKVYISNSQSLRRLIIMSEDFDSGDDLFDDVDVNDILQSGEAQVKQQSVSKPGHLQHQSQTRKRFSEEDRDDSSHKRPRRSSPQSLEEEDTVKLARRLLSDKFGYTEFRHEQEAAIKRILSGKSALVIFPTGAGKSLCYQVSGLPLPQPTPAYYD